MNFYWFGGIGNFLSVSEELEQNHFIGHLLAYDITNGDFFTLISRHLNKNNNIKHMVAIRPYLISPQYLSMIHKTIHDIAPGKLQINLVSGYVKDHEKHFGGVLGSVNDWSNSVDKINYTVEYIEKLNNLNMEILKCPPLDFYASVTNPFIYDVACKYNNKMILPYSHYKTKKFNLQGKNIMISISPILRITSQEINFLDKIKTNQDMEFFTYNDFISIITLLEKQGINQILLQGSEQEKEHIFKFVKDYQEGKSNWL